MTQTIIKRLKESRDPRPGIFWIIIEERDDEPYIIYLDIPDDPEFKGNSKNGLTYTHKNTWSDLVSREAASIRNKAWNYFPRGRVEIKNNKATIYLNPNINFKECQDQVIDAFKLSNISFRFVSDGSAHYHCHLDD